MTSFRHTKLVCTIGPASQDESVMASMLEAGMDVARLNLSHGTVEEHQRRVERLRALSRGRHTPLAILADIQGPKIRLGDFEPPLRLGRGDRLVLQGVEPGRPAPPGVIPVVYPPLARSVRAGSLVYLDDGVVQLTVEDVQGEQVVCRAMSAATVRARKGLALPGVAVELPALTDRDREHLRWAAATGVDMVAASFVRRGAHVEDVRAAWRAAGGAQTTPIIAKIESAEGLRHLDEIIEAADGVMVARGDLGVDISLEDVPLAQKDIIRRCNAAGKPVITATQMLESMVHNPSPTRAEVTDVANAIFDGTDAVMLSGETAAGEHPRAAVAMLHQIAVAAEVGFDHRRMLSLPDAELPPGVKPPTVVRAISRATCEVAQAVGASAILCSTQSGATARMVSRFRPKAPIVAATPFPEVARQLAVVWGVVPAVVPQARTIDEMLDLALGAARRTGLVRTGDRVVVAAGVKTDTPGSTNLVQVHEVP